MKNNQQKTRLSAGFLTECNTDVLRLDLSVSTLSQKALLVKFLHSNVDLTGIEPANSDSSDLNVHQYQAHKSSISRAQTQNNNILQRVLDCFVVLLLAITFVVCLILTTLSVIPLKKGIQLISSAKWIPAFAGMTMVAGMTRSSLRGLFSRHCEPGGRGNLILDCFVALLLAMTFLLSPTPAFAANSGIFTVSLWVKPTSTIASQALVGKAEELRVFTDASGYAGCQIKSTTWQTASTGSTALTLNSWNHVACTYDKATLKIYVNGVLANSNTLTATIDDTANALLLGQDSSASTPYSNLTGTTDDFKFYNYARTQKQVIEDMGEHPSVIASGARQSTISGPRGGPVAYYKFDEGQGTTANNSGSGGSALNGTLTGMATAPSTSTSGWTQAGKFNKALNFDGSYVSIPHNASLSLTNSITMSAWIKPTSSTETGFVIGGKGALTPPYAFYIENGALALQTSTSSVSTYNKTKTGTLNTSWQYVAVTWDGTTIKFYLNGRQYDCTGGFGTCSYTAALDTNSQSLNIGNRADPGYYYSGSIDEVKIYPYSLTAQEILTDYNHGSAQILGALGDKTGTGYESNQSANQEYCIPGDSTSCTSPVGRWDFDEGSGTSVKDVSGNGYNGTITGAAYKLGKIGKALNFNGSTDVVDTISSISGIQTVSFWVNPSTTTQNLIDLQTTPSAINVSVSGGALSATGFASPTYYINGIQTTSPTLAANNWTHVEITTGTAITGSAVRFGRISTTSLTGRLDNIRFFNYARSGAQVAWDYNRGAPLGHWKFDECQGDTAHDSSGNNNHGTINLSTTGTQTTALGMGTCTVNASTPWYNGRTGKFNYSLNFDGTSDYVRITNSSSLNTTGSLTYSYWLKINSLPSGNNTFSIVNNHIQNNGSPVSGVTTWIGSDGKPVFQLRVGNTCCQTLTSTTTLSTGQWYHITNTWNGSVMNVYVNGALAGTPTSVSGTLAINRDTFIGTNADDFFGTPSSYFNGQIDDVRVYNYALTPVQVKLLYNQNSGIRFGPSTGAP